MIEPKLLEPLTKQEIEFLISCFTNDPNKKILPYRQFGFNLTEPLKLIGYRIDDILGENNWICAGGNFFQTEVGYRVHADTGKEGPEKVWQTFVFPLETKTNFTPLNDQNKIIIFKQQWKGHAAFFTAGSKNIKSEYNVVVDDYKDVININSNIIDENVSKLCPHLHYENFQGLTVDKIFPWQPGVPITFPRDRLHVSTPFNRYGIKSKLGLSIFTSYNK